MISEQAEYFKKNHYVIIKNFVPKDMCTVLYYHILLAAQRLDYITQNKTHYNKEDLPLPNPDENIIKDIFGTFEDKQAMGDYSKYGEPIFDAMCGASLEKMQEHTGLQLTPTYTYHRLYTTGTELERHIDRESCEISTTICIGYNTSNLEDKNWNWPMYIKPKNDDEIPVYMEPGDMVIYRGCELEHWREPFIGLNHAQVFMHYNEKNGEYDIQNDGRAFLGLPQSFRE